jgi:hypothetical protein
VVWGPLLDGVRRVADNVRSDIVPDAGHANAADNPSWVAERLTRFIGTEDRMGRRRRLPEAACRARTRTDVIRDAVVPALLKAFNAHQLVQVHSVLLGHHVSRRVLPP